MAILYTLSRGDWHPGFSAARLIDTQFKNTPLNSSARVEEPQRTLGPGEAIVGAINDRAAAFCVQMSRWARRVRATVNEINPAVSPRTMAIRSGNIKAINRLDSAPRVLVVRSLTRNRVFPAFAKPILSRSIKQHLPRTPVGSLRSAKKTGTN
jgi:hypothetical protein